MSYRKHKLLSLCVCISSLSGLNAQTYMQIHVNGDIQKFPYEKVSEVQFSSDGIIVDYEGDDHPFLYSEITKINFGNEDTSGVSATDLDRSESQGNLTLSGNILQDPDGGTIHIYNLLGIRVASIHGSGDITALPNGIYIAHTNGKKLKFSKK